MNIFIYTGILLISFIIMYLTKKILGTKGLNIIFVCYSVLSLMLSFKYVTLGNININSNSITLIGMYTSLFLVMEEKGKKEAKKIINSTFLLLIFASCVCYLYTMHSGLITDTIHVNINNVFKNNYKFLLMFPISNLVANYLIVFMYPKIRKLYDIPFITTVSTYLFVGLIEVIMYTLLVFYGDLNLKTIIELILSNYMIRLIITIIYSFYLMFINKKKVTE